ncbi:MAG: M6 family metalloprotease domain-containing protein [Bacteroidales bacterium]|nr:M6 family metalloprotease domain-containing protein [Candidatus Latescibacterota bacterium]
MRRFITAAESMVVRTVVALLFFYPFITGRSISSQDLSHDRKDIGSLRSVRIPTVSPRPGIMPPEDRGMVIRPFHSVAGKTGKKGRFRYGSRWLDEKTSRAESVRMPFAPGRIPVPGGVPVKAEVTGNRAAVTGSLRVLVAAGLYSDFDGQPEDLDMLQQELFDGPWYPGTMTEYWDEVSSGMLDVTGDVRGWVELEQIEDYYTGGLLNWGIIIGTSHTDEMIEEIVAALDDSIDYGEYDNDGPDGIPNSGDDDGYVDILVIVHPTLGAECFYGYHMVSHSFQYSSWKDDLQPLATSDPAANGGTILIDDYNIAPTVSCEGGLIEIGVFCHEFGHFLGLPDLYDIFGRSGIGHWGLMGTGNWNIPESPSHICGWSKHQLGWVEAVDIGWAPEQIDLEPVEKGGSVVRMALPTERFRRRENLAPITGWSLICGYTAAEADARGYRYDGGYGNMWSESMAHEFEIDDSRPVTLNYSIGTDLEDGYDFAYVVIELYGSVDTLAAYTGRVDPVAEQLILDGFLPTGGCGFRIRFVLQSDYDISDEDGGFDSLEGWALHVDDISLSGGGLDYITDLEDDAGGWYCDSEPAEYFLVERRVRKGSDSELIQEGLLIYHAENSIVYGENGNSGGDLNAQARGVVLEEADGEYDMIEYNNPINFGDDSDPFPGSTGNTVFGTSSIPSSRSNSNSATPASITSITSSGGIFSAGRFPIEVNGSSPPQIVKTAVDSFTLDISGANIERGGTCSLSGAFGVVEAYDLIWLGRNRVLASFRSIALLSEDYDLVVTGGDGQTGILTGALEVESVFEDIEVIPGRSFITLSWTVGVTEGLRGCLLYRKNGSGEYLPVSPDTIRGLSGSFTFADSSVVSGISYRYMIEGNFGNTSEYLEAPGLWSITAEPFTLDNARPNPFSSSTTITLFVPERGNVTTDIYDVAGRKVSRIDEREYNRGTHTIGWEPGMEISSGVYFCVIRYGGHMKTIKLVLLR